MQHLSLHCIFFFSQTCTLPKKMCIDFWFRKHFTFENEVDECAEGVFRVRVEDRARQTGSESGESSEAGRLDLLAGCLKHLRWTERNMFYEFVLQCHWEALILTVFSLVERERRSLFWHFSVTDFSMFSKCFQCLEHEEFLSSLVGNTRETWRSASDQTSLCFSWLCTQKNLFLSSHKHGALDQFLEMLFIRSIF